MKAIVMAGGFGTRLGALATTTPKALLPIADKPLIEYILEKIEPLPGIETIYITTNKTFEPQFQNWLESSSAVPGITQRLHPKLTISTEPVVSEDHKLGAIGAWRHLIWQEKINDDIISIAGDNLFTFSLKQFVEKAQEKQSPTFLVHDVETIEEARKFGVCSIDQSNKITSFEEKPLEPKSTLVSTGIYYFPAQSLPFIERYLSEGNNKDAPGHFLSWLYSKIPLYAFSLPGHWFDIGSPETLKRAQQYFSVYKP